jgi:hypothetical protein
LDRAIEAARAPDLIALFRVVEGAVKEDRRVLYDLVRETEGGFAANLMEAWDRANKAADEA